MSATQRQRSVGSPTSKSDKVKTRAPIARASPKGETFYPSRPRDTELVPTRVSFFFCLRDDDDDVFFCLFCVPLFFLCLLVLKRHKTKKENKESFPLTFSLFSSPKKTIRLQTELMSLMTSRTRVFLRFQTVITFSAGSAPSKAPKVRRTKTWKYSLTLSFANEYLFKAPVVKFSTLCFHPNVDQFGNICLDILKEQWSPAYNVRTILLSIQSLLGEPNNDSPLNTHAAGLWSNQEEYRKLLQKKYKEDGAKK